MGHSRIHEVIVRKFRLAKRGAGFTFIEILVAGAVIVALAAAAFIFFGAQGTSSELQQLASQIGQKAAAQRRLMDQGLRKGQLSINEFAASIGAVINGTDYYGGTSATVAFVAPIACASGGPKKSGVIINMGVQHDGSPQDSPDALPAGSASVTEFQQLIIAGVREAVDGDNAKYGKLFKPSGTGGNIDINDLGKSKVAVPFSTTGTITASSSHQLYICIDDDA